MNLQEELMVALKIAMKAKDQRALMALRAIKAAIILVKTETGATGEISEDQELQILQKLVKQRKDSAAIFETQNRKDLAVPELEEVKIISQFLPVAMSEGEIEGIVVLTIESIGASGMKDMGKVMGIVSSKLAGKADGKTISTIVKSKLI